MGFAKPPVILHYAKTPLHLSAYITPVWEQRGRMWIGEVGSEGFTLLLQKVEYFGGTIVKPVLVMFEKWIQLCQERLVV